MAVEAERRQGPEQRRLAAAGDAPWPAHGRPAVSSHPTALVATTVALVAAVWLAPAAVYLLGFLGLVILTHELGHFLVARRCGMRPTELFWGFGPELWSVQVGGCRYGLKALMIGGYVKLEGMTPTSGLPAGFAEAGTYRAARHRARLATILAGPAVNLATAAAAFWAAAVLGGRGPVASLGTAVGDLWFVVSATGEALWVWVANLGGYAEALLDGSGRTEPPVRFLSPVAQARVSGQAVELGLAASLQWLGILAAAVGTVNLLPLPPLDGAHAVTAAAESLAQRVRGDRTLRFDVARLVPLAYVTIGLLLALSVSALVLDLRDLA